MEELKALGFALILLWFTLVICRRYLERIGLARLAPHPVRWAGQQIRWLFSREPSRTVRSRSRILPRHRE